jgi:hypothetical protein
MIALASDMDTKQISGTPKWKSYLYRPRTPKYTTINMNGLESDWRDRIPTHILGVEAVASGPKPMSCGASYLPTYGGHTLLLVIAGA